jgi:hypothetical protein
LAYIWSPDYRDENRDSRYPFADDATLVTSSGLALDPATFLDASVYPIGGSARAALTAIEVSNRLIRFWVGDGDNPRRASGEFDPLRPPETIHLMDPFGRPAGLLLANPILLAASQVWSIGTHAFPAGTAEFVASCVIPTPEIGVRGFLTADGDLLTGDVWWVGENGVVVRDDEGVVRIDVVGDPLFARRLCYPLGLFATPRFVRTINGIPPGPDGNFRIIVGIEAIGTPLWGT